MILLGVSEQSEQHDRDDFSRVLGIDVHIESAPPWFPVAAIAAEIRRRYPDLQSAGRYDDQSDEDGTRRLAAQVLHIETRVPDPSAMT